MGYLQNDTILYKELEPPWILVSAGVSWNQIPGHIQETAVVNCWLKCVWCGDGWGGERFLCPRVTCSQMEEQGVDRQTVITILWTNPVAQIPGICIYETGGVSWCWDPAGGEVWTGFVTWQVQVPGAPGESL